jgi:hypothetical protein
VEEFKERGWKKPGKGSIWADKIDAVVGCPETLRSRLVAPPFCNITLQLKKLGMVHYGIKL